jgi:polysaccharide biosynthesis/export protein
MNSSATTLRQLGRLILLSGMMFALLAQNACTTPPAVTQATTVTPPPQTLQPGDVVHLSFPGASSLDDTQQIRRDGKLNLKVVGEVEATGKTPGEFEKDLTALYATQVVSKEVKVTVVSSSFSVFVSGSVLHPGKIQPDHAITAFEAIMEAGGFDFAKANTKAVVVIRIQNGKQQNFTLNLQDVIDGKSTQPFYLQAGDIVIVHEKFQWF